jgi:hypothetical protein
MADCALSKLRWRGEPSNCAWCMESDVSTVPQGHDISLGLVSWPDCKHHSFIHVEAAWAGPRVHHVALVDVTPMAWSVHVAPGWTCPHRVHCAQQTGMLQGHCPSTSAGAHHRGTQHRACTASMVREHPPRFDRLQMALWRQLRIQTTMRHPPWFERIAHSTTQQIPSRESYGWFCQTLHSPGADNGYWSCLIMPSATHM